MGVRRAPWGVRIAAGLALLLGALASALVVLLVVLYLIPRTRTWLDMGTDLWLYVGFGAFFAISGLGSGIGLLRGNRSGYLTVLWQAGLGLVITVSRAFRDGVDLGLVIGAAIAATFIATLCLPTSRAYFRTAEDAARTPDDVRELR
jgi:hypothetical protein